MSPLLNYTTTVDAPRTVAEIEKILVKHGARSFLKNYDDEGCIESVSFLVPHPKGDISIRLPVDPDAVLKVLTRQRVQPRYRDQSHAVRVAWRIVKDWVEAQMAILETEMVKLEQIFLPYVITPSGQTLFEVMDKKGFFLGPGKEE